MRPKKQLDYQTIRFFVILGLLTLGLILVMKVVLFAPEAVPLVQSATR